MRQSIFLFLACATVPCACGDDAQDSAGQDAVVDAAVSNEGSLSPDAGWKAEDAVADAPSEDGSDGSAGGSNDAAIPNVDAPAKDAGPTYTCDYSFSASF